VEAKNPVVVRLMQIIEKCLPRIIADPFIGCCRPEVFGGVDPLLQLMIIKRTNKGCAILKTVQSPKNNSLD